MRKTREPPIFTYRYCDSINVGLEMKSTTNKQNLMLMLDIFHFQEYNKLHLELIDCPKLLATKLISTFPRLDLRKETLRIIKLSYHNYDDQNKGQLDVSLTLDR